MAKEYLVTKISFREDAKMIQDVLAYEYDGQALSEGQTYERNWMVSRTSQGSLISTMTPNPTQEGKWIRGKAFTYENGLYHWGSILPANITKRKTFVSYYHHDDQGYRTQFENLFGDLVVSKSVNDGDIDSDHCDEYIKQLIQNDYLSDTTVLVVLIGPKTKCRMHVDWEIAGALNRKVGETYAGLLGILLPTHPDYGSTKATFDLLPARLADNFKTGYAIIRDWTDDRVKIQSYIEQAFSNRTAKSDERINSRVQMTQDSCS
jgi:hypothetical protein